MTNRAKEYVNAVSRVLVRKYRITEIEAYKMIKNSFLYDSVIHFEDETIHDDVEMNADAVYEDYKNPELKMM